MSEIKKIEQLTDRFIEGINDEKIGKLVEISIEFAKLPGSPLVARSFNTILQRSLKRMTWILRTISCSRRTEGVEHDVACADHIRIFVVELTFLFAYISRARVREEFSLRLAFTLGGLFKAAIKAPEMIDKPIGSTLSTLPYETSCTKMVYIRNDKTSKRAKMSDKAAQILEGDLIMSYGDSVIPNFDDCSQYPPGARFEFEGVALTTVSNRASGSRYQPFGVAVCGACYIRNVTPEAVKPGDFLEVVPNHGAIRLHDEAGERRPACTVPYRSKVGIPNILVLSRALPGGTCCVLVLN